MKKLTILVMCLPILGCATPCPGPEVVEITRTEYVPIPRSLVVYDEVLDHQIETNGDLLEAYKIWRQAAEERARLLDEVANLQPK